MVNARELGLSCQRNYSETAITSRRTNAPTPDERNGNDEQLESDQASETESAYSDTLGVEVLGKTRLEEEDDEVSDGESEGKQGEDEVGSENERRGR